MSAWGRPRPESLWYHTNYHTNYQPRVCHGSVRTAVTGRHPLGIGTSGIDPGTNGLRGAPLPTEATEREFTWSVTWRDRRPRTCAAPKGNAWSAERCGRVQVSRAPRTLDPSLRSASAASCTRAARTPPSRTRTRARRGETRRVSKRRAHLWMREGGPLHVKTPRYPFPKSAVLGLHNFRTARRVAHRTPLDTPVTRHSVFGIYTV